MTVTETPPATEAASIDLLAPTFYGDGMHESLTWMRANEPFFHDTKGGVFGVTRHADVHEVEGRSDAFVSGQGYRSFVSPGETNMIAQDDPRHAAQRGLVARRFTPKAVRAHEPWMRSTVDALIDGFAGGTGPGAGPGEVEVVDAVAAQLPCRLTARLLGWPEDRWADVKSWSERLMRYDAIAYDGPAMVEMMEAIIEFNGDLQAMVSERKGCPVDHDSDLTTVWANAEIDGVALDAESIMHETGLFISGGAETTRTVIARGLRTFCDHPDQWERLATDPAVVSTAVDELVRWVTPLNNFFRTAATDAVVAEGTDREHRFSAGDRLVLLYPSANRDEAVFADPFTFDITRSPNPHLGFGFGTHFCLGASLARFELTMLFSSLAQRITNLRVAEELVPEANMFACAVQSFHLGFDWR